MHLLLRPPLREHRPLGRLGDGDDALEPTEPRSVHAGHELRLPGGPVIDAVFAGDTVLTRDARGAGRQRRGGHDDVRVREMRVHDSRPKTARGRPEGPDRPAQAGVWPDSAHGEAGADRTETIDERPLRAEHDELEAGNALLGHVQDVTRDPAQVSNGNHPESDRPRGAASVRCCPRL
ncbi:hypothetical protein PSCLAVI8L_80034 [Pseudoclavibacter sp. 8L]|nr:hypothetical protein PSCLAVI8L_80034 [Pseudoclavibacter sp. 8L]